MDALLDADPARGPDGDPTRDPRHRQGRRRDRPARVRHITFPLLANLYLICTLLSTIFLLGDFNAVTFVSGGGPANQTHVLATLGIRDAFEIANPRLGVAAVMSALPMVIPLVIVLMRKLRTAEVQL